jgi:hypothetical protein
MLNAVQNGLGKLVVAVIQIRPGNGLVEPYDDKAGDVIVAQVKLQEGEVPDLVLSLIFLAIP